MRVTFCGCETEAETLVQLGFFLATPKQPQLVFILPLMEWMEALMLECQVSAQEFAAALKLLSGARVLPKKCNLGVRVKNL